MKVVKIFFLLIGLISSVYSHAGDSLPPASIGVSPTRVEVTVQDRTTTGSATVMNFTDKPVHISASLTSFDLDEGNNFRELAPETGSLPRAMMLNPADFTIPPYDAITWLYPAGSYKDHHTR